MKTIRTFLSYLVPLIPSLCFSGNTITYTFDTGGNGYGPIINGTDTTYTALSRYGTTYYKFLEISTLSSLGATAGSDANTTNIFHGKSYVNNTQSVDLTAFPGSTDQQVIWKTYLKTATTSTKACGVILRAQNTVSGYSTGVRQGYFFMANGTTTSGTVQFRITKLTSNSSVTNIVAATNQSISGLTNGPLYLKAKAVNSKLYFEYSTDGTNFTAFTGSPFTDASFTSGTVQLAWALGAGSGIDQYYDDITISDLSVPKVTISGYNKYSYIGTSTGPKDTLSTSLFSSKPTLTWSYKGIGTTTYTSSATAPTQPGQYAAIINASNGSQTANDTLAFEILPSGYSKQYLFNTDSKGSEPTNTYSKSSSKFIVQTGLGYISGYKSSGNMITPNGNAITTLASFGNTDSIADNYSIIWKDYPTAISQKRGIILRANGTNRFQVVSANMVNVGKGYLFYVFNSSATALQLDIRKIEADTTVYKSPVVLASTNTLTYNGINSATWYKATVKGDSLIFAYSLDGNNWTTVHKIKDDGTKGNVYTSGTTQVCSINGGGSSYYFDYFGYQSISTVTTSVQDKITDTHLAYNLNKTIVVNAGDFEIYSVIGTKLAAIHSSNSPQSFSACTGIYIIKAGSKVQKVIIP